jgi:hypothetical protein
MLPEELLSFLVFGLLFFRGLPGAKRPAPLTFNTSASHISIGVSTHWRMLPRTISLTRSARHALIRRCNVRIPRQTER